MHRVNTAANFIKANMPLGKPITLTDQQAWDVAAFINSHERPQDPRFTGTVKETQAKYHNHNGYYGKEVDGKIAGENAYPNPLKK
jgi:thiosulfate dehydrogenase